MDELPSLLKLKAEMQGYKYIMPIVKLLFYTPFVKNKKELKQVLSEFPEMEEQLKKFNEIPGAFNELFISKGWIAHGSLNFKLMEEAVQLAQKEEFEKAEEALLAHFTDEIIDLDLNALLWKSKLIQKRRTLLEYALEDYKNCRYHACIPVVLMMIDGIICDVNPEQKSGSSVNLTVWDSFIGLKNALDRLNQEVLHKTCRKTTEEKITVPYRNGIMHGRSLGYANKEVAIKSWNILLQ